MGTYGTVRRAAQVALAASLTLALAACTGRGGGYLASDLADIKGGALRGPPENTSEQVLEGG